MFKSKKKTSINTPAINETAIQSMFSEFAGIQIYLLFYYQISVTVLLQLDEDDPENMTMGILC